MNKSNLQNLIPIFYILVSCFITFSTFPIVNKIALRFGLIDKPNARKQHNLPTVRIGGITMIFGYLFVLLLTIFFKPLKENLQFFQNIQILSIIFGGLIMFLIGLADDIKGMSPWSRLVSQFAISSFLWSRGLSLYEINFETLGISNLIISLNPLFSYLFTVIWLVGITNAFNWIDGLDGLAAGISFISALSFAILFNKVNSFELVCLSSIIIGCSIGFLKNNFFPAKIFMGDGGAYFLGFSLGSLALCDFTSASTNKNFIPCVIILMLPLIDMTTVISKRVLQGKSPFYPDKTHFHHYLLNKGFNHKSTVLILYSLSVIFALGSFVTTRFNF